MSEPDQSGDKQYEPTQKRLEDARQKGEIPRSAEMTAAAGYAGFLVAAFALGAIAVTEMASALANMLRNADLLATDAFAGGGLRFGASVLLAIASANWAWFAFPATAAALAVIAQRAFLLTPSKLAPKASRISPLSNARNKFGRQGLFEFAKSFSKLLIFSAILSAYLAAAMPDIAGSIRLGPSAIVAFMLDLSVDFIALIVLVSLVIGAADLIWQHADHRRRNMMSRQDMVDEAKQSEGDPHIRQQRQQRAQAIATNRMLADVPTADVVLVNPQHYAVALKWTRLPGSAPECVAKGVDEIAARIREVALQSGVPVYRDPPTTRALFASVDIGQQINPEHYRAVAAAIRFAEAMRSRASRNGYGK